MNSVELVWSMLGAASLTLGLIHVAIWARQPSELAQFAFGLAAFSVAALAVAELMMTQAESPEQFAAILRWAHAPVATLALGLVGFVHLHFGLKGFHLGWFAAGLRLASLVPNFGTGVNINFQSIESLRYVSLWDSDRIAFPVGEPNPWMLLAQLSNLLLMVFLARVAWMRWRRGADRRSRRGVGLCIALALFVLASSGWTAAVVLGWVSGPLTVNVAFFGVVLMVSYELGGEALKSAQLTLELKRSEVALRENKQRLALAAKAAGLGIWTRSLDEDDIWLSERGRELLGLAGDSPASWSVIQRGVEPADRAAVEAALQSAIQGSGDYECEFRYEHPVNGTRWLEAKGQVEFDSGGDARAVRGVLFDVTDKRFAGEGLRRVVEDSPFAMIVVDASGMIILVNAMAERTFGYDRSALLGVAVGMILELDSVWSQAEDAGEHAVAAGASEPRNRSVMLAGRHQDGSSLQLEVTLTPIRINDAPCTLSSIKDIGAELRVEQEMALQRDEVAHLSRVAMLGEISGSLAHELNQPLTAVLSNAQAALRFLEREPPDLVEVRDALVHIIESDKRASEVIRRLRVMLRKERSDHAPMAINEVIRDVFGLLESDLIARGITLSLRLDKLLPEVSGDRVQIQQVLLNLVFNACDAMSHLESGRLLEVRSQEVEGPAVRVSVRDVGSGIPEQDLERILTPFVTTKSQGIGLGLAICGTIVRAHRGRLWAGNNAGGGATLHFELPVDRQAD